MRFSHETLFFFVFVFVFGVIDVVDGILFPDFLVNEFQMKVCSFWRVVVVSAVFIFFSKLG